MKSISIVGKNYVGHFDKVRVACRALILKDDKILLSVEKKNDLWMIPGGGLESGESINDCVIREVREETGYVISESEPVLEIVEMYENRKYISNYYFGNVIGNSEKHLTSQEIGNDLDTKWVDISFALDIFSKHQDFENIDEGKRGLYLREYSALKELLDIEK